LEKRKLSHEEEEAEEIKKEVHKKETKEDEKHHKDDEGNEENVVEDPIDILKRNLSAFFSKAHLDTINLADKMFYELKRLYYVTPTNYIELVNGYVHLL